MIGFFVYVLIGLVLGNIFYSPSLSDNVRYILMMIFCRCAMRAVEAYDDREIKPLTIALVSCIVCVVCVALTF